MGARVQLKRETTHANCAHETGENGVATIPRPSTYTGGLEMTVFFRKNQWLLPLL